MDPNLFRLDWEQVSEVLATIVVLAFLVERALALMFEYRPFAARYASSGLKEPIAFLVSLLSASAPWRATSGVEDRKREAS